MLDSPTKFFVCFFGRGQFFCFSILGKGVSINGLFIGFFQLPLLRKPHSVAPRYHSEENCIITFIDRKENCIIIFIDRKRTYMQLLSRSTNQISITSQEANPRIYFCRRHLQALQIYGSCQIRKPLHHAGTPNDPKKINTKISCELL